MNIRNPAVAGTFYPFSKEDVKDGLKELFGYWGIKSFKKRKECFGVVVPHAGWEYSGYVAAKVYAEMPEAETVILMGPNHYGIGPDFSISSSDAWRTPLGEVEVDTELAKALEGAGEREETAHAREHSIEVQIPFLQTVLKEFKILPISIKHYTPDKEFLDRCREFGKAIVEVVRDSGKKVVIVASTDFTHYEPRASAVRKDAMAIKEIERLDEAGLFETIRKNNISMCGYAGVAAAIVACKELGAKKAEKVAYMTSGDVTGDVSQVVGYAGMRLV